MSLANLVWATFKRYIMKKNISWDVNKIKMDVLDS